MDQRVETGPANKFLRNAWYPFAWEEEIGDGPFGRTILSAPGNPPIFDGAIQ